MASNDYHFVTHWRVKSTREEITEIFSNSVELVRWWPSVYLNVQELAHGDERGIGQVIDLYTKGWLPYTLRWQFIVTEIEIGTRIALKASGDFNGQGIWTFEQDGEWVNITYDWRIQTDKPLLKYLSPIMKPLFSANHRWAMEMGLKSLALEIERRRAISAEQLARVPAPPPPIPEWPFVVGGVAVLGLIVWWSKSSQNELPS